jgi:membrane protein DedA with SNARE-associated domain
VSELTDLLLTGLLNHGSSLLGGALFLAALGVPLPATMLLVAAGAFARQGVLPIQAAVVAGVVGAVAGDASSYLVGRFAGRWLPAGLKEGQAWRRVGSMFVRWGSWSIFFSRFLLTPVALPVNLMAGSTHYPWHRFMLPVVVGEVIWVLLFGGLGHLFADRWEHISALAGDMAGLLLGALLVATGIYALAASRRGKTQAGQLQVGRKPSTDR